MRKFELFEALTGVACYWHEGMKEWYCVVNYQYYSGNFLPTVFLRALLDPRRHWERWKYNNK
jgi:hypothetical protein